MNKLLIVDDDAIMLEVLKGTLSKQYDIVTTTTSKGALGLFLSDPTLVVILDLNMPEKSGKEIMLEIFAAGYKPIVIILTGETDIKTVVELFKIGVHDYIVKPFNSLELTNRVDKAFEIAELRIINENI